MVPPRRHRHTPDPPLPTSLLEQRGTQRQAPWARRSLHHPKPSRRGKLHTGRSIHNTATAEDLPPEDRGSTKTVTEATQD